MEKGMKQIALGILAHVDAGKTTLSEGLLFSAGEIRKLGRVDDKDAFLDINEIERKRGITIFSKQAIISLEDTVITLLDTPGHVDFSAEAERVLSVLDYAVLVISGTDGIQSHTKTLWSLLEKHSIPMFVFINKMDLIGADKERVLDELKDEFGDGFIDFTEDKESICNNLAFCSEKLMDEVLSGELSIQTVSEAIKKRKVYPCFSGSALKMQGVDYFLKAFDKLTLPIKALDSFGAKVFKIGQDDKGNRLTYMKITGGSLKVKSLIKTGENSNEKVNEIRIYSGEKYQTKDEVCSGCVCAVTGLKQTFQGQGLGFEENATPLTAEPIFTYRVVLPQDVSPSVALEKFKELQQEETQLMVTWNNVTKEIQLRVMGEIQLEILKQLVKTRFDMDVDFEEGRILYKETIENTVEGVGHFEPLRHYAEVHLLLTPLPRGSGMQFETDCPENILDKNWQRLILTHLMEKQHIGVLTGSAITDIKITLKSGAAHLKHTEGGDFRQATYRAVRQGLMQAKSVLLEPYYDFIIEIPAENVGKVMTDLNLMGADFSVLRTGIETSKIKGTAPAELIRNYQRQITAYTHGTGRITCQFGGYGPCKNADSIIESIGYIAEEDTENTPDSVFCSHGAGFHVKWNEVFNHMHLESVLNPKKTEKKIEDSRIGSSLTGDDELLQIFEMTYGKVETKLPSRAMHTQKEIKHESTKKYSIKKYEKSYLLIDGYNMIFAWDSLKKIAKDNLEDARKELINRLCVYKVFKDTEIILVFDAYKVKGNRGEVEREKGITIVYTKESQTADAYIEKTAKELTKNYHVTVATSDALEQLIIFGSGALRMTARYLEEDILNVERAVSQMVEAYNLETNDSGFLRVLEEKLTEWKTGE
ncbi:MAG: TetM/TetW/TetO/TetS family tetracycline resistance ribosomal protection protein [Clostridia bacterium]|nr:TetM/TetW/TetO/TetS family tetracycline resistance ribosomal protection protein [Clostridia bacterium]